MTQGAGLLQVGQRADDEEDLDQPPTKTVVREEADTGDDDIQSSWSPLQGSRGPAGPAEDVPQAQALLSPRGTGDLLQQHAPLYSHLGGQQRTADEASLQG